MAAIVIQQKNSEIPFSIRAACEAIGWTAEDLSGLIYNKMKQIYPRITDAARKVIARLLWHSNDTDNRVWASIACIAEEAPGRGEEGGLATSTVESALADLREAGAIRPVQGDELYAGNGAHRAKERGVKRKGHHPITHYDISGCFGFLPHVFRYQLNQAARRVQLQREEESKQAAMAKAELSSSVNASNSSFLEKERIVPGEHKESEIPLTSISKSTRQDLPIDSGPPGSISSVGIGIVQKTSPAVSPRMQTTTNPRPLPEPTPRREVPTPKNQGQNKCVENAGKAANITNQASSSAAWVPASEQERYAVAALQVVGLHPIRRVGGKVLDVPNEIVRTMGVKWSLELVEYFFWMRRRGHNVQPGYLRNTWENWQRGDGEWGEKFASELDRPNRARSLPTIAQMQARVEQLNKPKEEKIPPSAPVPATARKNKVSEAKPPPVATVEWSPESVPESDRAKLLVDAQAEVFKQPMYGTETRRDRIRGYGWDHAGVRNAAQQILKDRDVG